MDHYRIIKDLAKGGQGVARLASNLRGETVVVKSVVCDTVRGANVALCEAKVLQPLRHRNVVRYVDVFVHQDSEMQELHVCTVMVGNGGSTRYLLPLLPSVHYAVTCWLPPPPPQWLQLSRRGGCPQGAWCSWEGGSTSRGGWPAEMGAWPAHGNCR